MDWFVSLNPPRHQQPTLANPTRIEYTTTIHSRSRGLRVMPETIKKAIKQPAKTPKATTQAKGSTAPAKTPVAPKKTGRPSKYDPEIARIICEQLSEGIPLRQICRDNDGFPAWRTVYDWMGRDDALSASIARARDIGYDALAEECLHIADTPTVFERVTETIDRGFQRQQVLGHHQEHGNDQACWLKSIQLAPSWCRKTRGQTPRVRTE